MGRISRKRDSRSDRSSCGLKTARTIRRMLLRAFFSLLLLPLLALAEPTVKIAADGDIAPRSGQSVDLIVTVDPGPEGLPLAGLKLAVSGNGGDFGAPILPPPDQEGRYGAPFDIRVPMQVTAGDAFEVSATLTSGSITATGKGNVFALPGDGAPTGLPGGLGDIAPAEPGTLQLKKAYLGTTPAVAGQRNTLVLELELTGAEYHVYGLLVPGDESAIGVPMVFEILPNGPEDEFRSVGPFTPPPGKYKGAFKVEIPVTPVKDGPFPPRSLHFTAHLKSLRTMPCF